MASLSTSESHGSSSRKFDDDSNFGSGKSETNSPEGSTSSLGVAEMPSQRVAGINFSTQLDNKIPIIFDHKRSHPANMTLGDRATDSNSTTVSSLVPGTFKPILDASIFELEPNSPGGYALLVFNISTINLQHGGPLDWIDNKTVPIVTFEDGSGFIRACSTLDQLHHEAVMIEHTLKYFCTQPLSFSKGLQPLVIASKWVSLEMACRSLCQSLSDCTKEVAITACMRNVDWFVQATTAWPAVAADRNNLLLSLIDYLVVALGKIPVSDRQASVLDMFHLIEVPAVSMNSVMVMLRLVPGFNGSDCVTEAIAQKLVSDCLMHKNGWNWNSISHYLHPARPDILGGDITSGMPQFVELGSLTEAFIARRVGHSHESSAVSDLRHKSRKDTFSTATEMDVDFRMPWDVEAGFQNSFPSSRRHFTRPNSIDVERIYKGLDVRTTIMLRNLPNRLTHVDLYEHLLAACPGEFDFLYVRIDFSNGCNVGYGFVNMISPQSVIGFVESFRGFRWPGSEKIAEVSYATQQGREALISRFRNSSVMTQPETHRPKLYFPLGTPQAGLEERFPKPDNLAKLHRSQQNADAEGLYESRGRRGVAAGRRRAGMLDPHHTHNGGGMHNYDPMLPAPMNWPVYHGEYRPAGPQPCFSGRVGHRLGNVDSGHAELRPVQPGQSCYDTPRRGGRAIIRGH